MDQTGIKLLIDQTKQNNPQFFNLKYKKNNECDICFENHFYKKEIINCSQCKKPMCYNCYQKYISNIKNLMKLSCPYCRFQYSLKNIVSIINQLENNICIIKHLNITLFEDCDFISEDSDIEINREEDSESESETESEINLIERDDIIEVNEQPNELQRGSNWINLRETFTISIPITLRFNSTYINNDQNISTNEIINRITDQNTNSLTYQYNNIRFYVNKVNTMENPEIYINNVVNYALSIQKIPLDKEITEIYDKFKTLINNFININALRTPQLGIATISSFKSINLNFYIINIGQYVDILNELNPQIILFCYENEILYDA